MHRNFYNGSISTNNSSGNSRKYDHLNSNCNNNNNNYSSCSSGGTFSSKYDNNCFNSSLVSPRRRNSYLNLTNNYHVNNNSSSSNFINEDECDFFGIEAERAAHHHQQQQQHHYHKPSSSNNSSTISLNNNNNNNNNNNYSNNNNNASAGSSILSRYGGSNAAKKYTSDEDDLLLQQLAAASHSPTRDDFSHYSTYDPLTESENHLRLKWLDNSPRMSRLREHRQKRLVNKLEQFELWDLEQEQKQKQYELAREQRYKNIMERLKSQEMCVSLMKKRHESDLETSRELELYANDHLYVDAMDDPTIKYQGPISQYRKFQAEMDDKLKNLQNDIDNLNPRYRIEQAIIPRIERTRELYSVEPDTYTQRGKRVQKRPNLHNKFHEDHINVHLHNNQQINNNFISNSRDRPAMLSQSLTRSGEKLKLKPIIVNSSSSSQQQQSSPQSQSQQAAYEEGSGRSSSKNNRNGHGDKKVVYFNDDIEYNNRSSSPKSSAAAVTVTSPTENKSDSATTVAAAAATTTTTTTTVTEPQSSSE